MNWENVLISTGVGLITGLLGFFSGRSKNKAETKETFANALGVEIANLRLIIESWREHSKQLEDQIDKQDQIIREQSSKINELQLKVNELTKQVENHCKTCNLKQK